MMTLSKDRQFPFRTTLSLREEMGRRLEVLAKQQGLSVLHVARMAIEQYVRAETGDGEIGGGAARQARSLVGLTHGFENPYQDLLASWRIARTRRQIADVLGSHLELDAWPAEIYLLRILTELLQKLGAGDEFLVVTNLGFWRNASAAESDDGRTVAQQTSPMFQPGTPQPRILGPEFSALYLSAQKEAVAKGMRLCRMFLLSKDDWTNGAAELELHRRFLRDLNAEERSRVQLRCRRVDDLEAAIVRIGHFACVRRVGDAAPLFSPTHRDMGAFVVEPVHQGHHIKHLRLLFSQGISSHDDPTVKFYVDRFFAAADESTTSSLDQMPTRGASTPSIEAFQQFAV